MPCRKEVWCGCNPAPWKAGIRRRLWRQLAASWVGAGRTLQDSPGTGGRALGSTLDKHHCSQHRSFELAEKLVCSGVGLLISLFCWETSKNLTSGNLHAKQRKPLGLPQHSTVSTAERILTSRLLTLLISIKIYCNVIVSKSRFKSPCYFIKSASFLNYFPKEKPIQSVGAQLISVMKLQLCIFNLALSIFQLVKKQNQKKQTKPKKPPHIKKWKHPEVTLTIAPWAIPANVSMQKSKKKGYSPSPAFPSFYFFFFNPHPLHVFLLNICYFIMLPLA